jgi:hypothetical protein
MLAKAFTEISTVLRTALFFAGVAGVGWGAARAVHDCSALLFLLGTVAMAAVIFAVLTGFLFTSRG